MDTFAANQRTPAPGPERGLILREFQPGDEEAFRRINEEWITGYFALEPKDVATLGDPRRQILDAGGRIFVAVRSGVVAGCCALLAMGGGEYEVAKMGVLAGARGGGIGRALLEFAVASARASGATRLYLETNAILATAIRLYEGVGFRHLPAERIVASPYARANVYMELWL